MNVENAKAIVSAGLNWSSEEEYLEALETLKGAGLEADDNKPSEQEVQSRLEAGW